MAIADDVERYLRSMFPEIDWNVYRPITGNPYVTVYADRGDAPWRLPVADLKKPGSHKKLLAIGREAIEKRP